MLLTHQESTILGLFILHDMQHLPLEDIFYYTNNTSLHRIQSSESNLFDQVSYQHEEKNWS